MELARLVEALSRPEAYPHPASDIVVHHTHISVVFLAGPYAYKIKKPLDLGFLDFTTLEKRRRFCLEEVRLNARLAPGAYLGVVPVVARDGEVRIGSEGSPRGAAPPAPEDSPQSGRDYVTSGSEGSPRGAAPPTSKPSPMIKDYAVWMERLPDEATLEFSLARDDVDQRLISGLAERIAVFHARAERGERIAACGRWDVVSGNCRENFEQSAPQVGTTLSAAVYERLRDLTGRALERLRPLIERRAEAGLPCDTHGDLRLDHVYVFPDRPPPRDLVVVDCIEFNERFRYADPVADMAFLAMDLAFQGRRDLAGLFAEAYFRASRDAEGRELLSFYAAYRAAVRGKVEGFEALSREVPDHERADALRTSRAHWLLALVELEEPGRRPCLVLVAGLPGTGKSTLARGLAAAAGFEVVASDTVRKELAGLTPTERAAAGFGEGLYTDQWNERTYAECLRRATQLLFEGRRVIVDASFREEARRREFLETARAWGVPCLLLLCTADPEVIRDRLLKRKGDVSDADWEVYRRAAERWEEMAPITMQESVEIPTGGGPNDALSAALTELCFRHLVAMGRDSPMKVRDAIKLLERDGWRLVVMRGSHRQFKHAAKRGRVTVAGNASDDLSPGTWKSILKQAQLEGDG